MTRTPFSAKWIQAGANIFQWGRKAAYWKGRKGWWASRKDFEGIKGPFRTPGAALKWAEEPYREAHRAKLQALREEALKEKEERRARFEAQKARAAERAAAKEVAALITWNGLPAEERTVQVGQVWAMRDPRHEGHQILVVEVKKKIAVAHARDSKATPWKGLPREPRTLGHIPKLYRLVGKAKVPALPKRKR